MPSNENPNPLVRVTDLFGASKPLEQLVSAIERGVGNLLRPIQKRRETKVDIASYEDWNEALKRTGLEASRAELTLGERATVRVTAEHARTQRNREAVAVQAISDYRNSVANEGHDESGAGNAINAEWLDRFWRLSENVSDTQMQEVWGRVLSRKARGAAQYSARCLEALSLLSRDEAIKLERLSRFVMSARSGGIQTHFFLLDPKQFPNDRANELAKEIMKIVGALHRSIFGPAGLYVDSGSGWLQDVAVDVADGIADVSIARIPYVIRFPGNKDCISGIGSGLGITPLGAEIFSIIETQPERAYVEKLSEALSIYGLHLTPV
ncbi:DUF2806 domain-containing protein [Bradyrhizobium oligotrophicum]|uniref:DUF2806 domain-containing protein n=1 Tax=Bradyrhizobium oligotrophicum TaxID=44255 RepID=UPI003EC000A1